MSARKARRVVHATAAVAVLVLIVSGFINVRQYLRESLDISRLDFGNPGAPEAAMRLARSRSTRAVPPLVRLLKEAAPHESWVSEALLLLGPAAERALVRELEDGWDEGDDRVASFLGDLESRAAIPALTKCLETVEDREERFEVVECMLEIDPGAALLVRPLLRSPRAGGRLGAIECFRLSEEARSHAGDLRPLLGDPDPEVRFEAAFVLARLGGAGEETVPVLVEALQYPDWHTRETAARALGRLGEKARAALPPLVECLGQASTMLSSTALDALLRIDPRDAAPLAARLLEHEDAEVRGRILGALGPLSLHNNAYVATVVRAAARETDGSTPWGAISDLGPAARAAVPDLVELLAEPDGWQRYVTIHALGGIGEPAIEAVPALEDLERRGPPDTRESARWALEEICPSLAVSSAPSQEDVEALLFRARAGGLEERRDAIGDLGSLDTRAKDIIPALVDGLEDPEEEIRAATLYALAELGTSEPVHLLRAARALSDDAEDVRSAAVRFLQDVDAAPDELVQEVVALLPDSRKEVREAAVDALAGLESRDPRAVRELAARLADEEPHVRCSAAWALLGVSGAASPAAPLLAKALDDADDCARLVSAVVLWTLDPRDEDISSMLSGALQEKDGGTLVASALAEKGEAAAPLLRKAFRSKSSDVRARVCEALTSPGAAWAIPELTEAVAEDGFVADRALRALAAIGPAAREAGPAIVEAVEGYEYDWVRVSAGYALGRLGVSAEVAVRTLARVLEGSHVEFRERAASCLGAFGSAARPALEKALRDPEGSVRKAAARALRRVEEE